MDSPSIGDLRRCGAPLTRHLRFSVKRDLLKVSRSPQLFSTVGPQPLAVAKPVSDNAAGGRASIWFHRKAYGLASSGIGTNSLEGQSTNCGVMGLAVAALLIVEGSCPVGETDAVQGPFVKALS